MTLFTRAQKKTKGPILSGSEGFTIIETMIAMAIFTILVTIGIGSVLSAIQQHHTSENTRTVMDNLNFVMEDMARNIRLGTNVRCLASGETLPVFSTGHDPVVPEDCTVPAPAGAHNAIVLNDQNGNDLVYFISSGSGGTGSQIFKQMGNGLPQLISPPEVKMDYGKSGFTVHGSQPSSDGDMGQPTVTIRLVGTVTYEGVNSTFAVETTVTLRSLDS